MLYNEVSTMIKKTLAGMALSLAALVGCYGAKESSSPAVISAPVKDPEIFPTPVPVCDSKVLELYEDLYEHFRTLTSAEWPAVLKDGSITNAQGTTQYLQRLTHAGRVIFGQNEYNIVDTFFHAKDGQTLFSYAIAFPDKLKSSRNLLTNGLPDLVGVQFNILGKDYVVDAVSMSVDGDMKMNLTSLDGLTMLAFSDNSNDVINGFSVRVNGIPVPEGRISFNKIFDADTAELDSIVYKLAAETPFGDLYVPPGEGVRQHLQRPQALLSDGWDVLYAGLNTTNDTTMLFSQPQPSVIDFSFVSRENIPYSFALAENVDGKVSFSRNYNSNRLRFIEGEPIVAGDRFILNKPGSDLTRVLEYNTIDTVARQVTFQDLGTGTRQVTYDAVTKKGDLIVGGDTFAFQVDEANGNALYVDLNGDGALDGSGPNGQLAHIVNKFGGKLHLPQLYSAPEFYVKIEAPGSGIDSRACNPALGGEAVPIQLSARDNVNMDVSVLTQLESSGSAIPDVHYDLPANMFRGMSQYGVEVQHMPSARLLYVQYPQTQRKPRIAFTP